MILFSGKQRVSADYPACFAVQQLAPALLSFYSLFFQYCYERVVAAQLVSGCFGSRGGLQLAGVDNFALTVLAILRPCWLPGPGQYGQFVDYCFAAELAGCSFPFQIAMNSCPDRSGDLSLHNCHCFQTVLIVQTSDRH